MTGEEKGKTWSLRPATCFNSYQINVGTLQSVILHPLPSSRSL
jgi:hypothetical protein